MKSLDEVGRDGETEVVSTSALVAQGAGLLAAGNWQAIGRQLAERVINLLLARRGNISESCIIEL